MTLAYLLRYMPTLSETFVYDELEELDRQGEQPSLWALDPGPAGPVHPGLEPLLGRCRRVPRAHRPSVLTLAPAARSGALRETWDRWGGRGKDLRRALWLADDLARRGIRGLHVHFAAEMAEVAWVARQRRGIGYSVTVHARDLYCPRPSLAEVLAGARAVVTISEANRLHLVDLGIPGLEERLHVIRQGLRLPPPPVDPPPWSEPLRLLTVGRLVPKKGHDLLLRALASAVSHGLDATLVVVGEGPERARLAHLSRELGLEERITWSGGLPRDQVESLLARGTDLFALACRVADDGDRDGIPVALMEAMARGIPVISTDVSGIPELVRDGQTGVLVPAEDPAAFAEAIAHLAADPSLRRRVVTAARAQVEEAHELTRQVARLRQVFTRAHTPPDRG